MNKEKPLYERIYQDPLYIAIIRFVHYKGVTWRDLCAKMDEWKQEFPRKNIDQHVYHMVWFEAQNRCNVKPLEPVHLRQDVRKLAFQILGPPPEMADQFYRHANGEPTAEHAEKMASLQKPLEVK